MINLQRATEAQIYLFNLRKCTDYWSGKVPTQQVTFLNGHCSVIWTSSGYNQLPGYLPSYLPGYLPSYLPGILALGALTSSISSSGSIFEKDKRKGRQGPGERRLQASKELETRAF
jgi:hypothetical protein